MAFQTYLFSQQLGTDPVQERVHYSRTARCCQQHIAAAAVVAQVPLYHVFVQDQDHSL